MYPEPPHSDYENLRYQEARNAHVIVSIADKQGNITYVNDLFCDISGYSKDELLGQNHRILKSEVHGPEFYRAMWQTIASGKIWSGEVCNLRKNGEHYWVKATITPFLDEQGKPYQYVSYRTDITEIKNQEQDHLTLLNSLGEGVYGVNAQGICTFINPSALTMLGYRKDQILNKSQHYYFSQHNNGAVSLSNNCLTCLTLRDRQPRRGEDWFVQQDGSRFPVELNVTPRFDYGQFVGIQVIFHDISERKEAESLLRVNEERFRRSQYSANIGTWDWNIETGELYWSERIGPLFGYPNGDLKTSYDNFLGALHPEDRQSVIDAIDSAVVRDKPYEIEHRVVWPDGQVRWLLERGAVYRDESGNALKMLGTVMDINDRKLMELKLKQSEERLSVALEGAGDGIWEWNLETDEMQFSELYAKMLGYRKDELAHKVSTWIDGIHPNDCQRVKNQLQDYLEGKLSRFDVEFRLRCKDNSWKWILCRGKVISRNIHDQPLRMTAIHTDISSRKAMENELLQAKEEAEKANRAKSEFLSSMSHELRTPLNAILGFTQLLINDPTSPLNDEQHESATHILNSGQHLLALINDVLELAKIESGNIETSIERIVLSEVISACLPVLQNLADEKQVTIETGANFDHCVYADFTRLKQVFINLITNAIKYNKPGGSVSIHCSERTNQFLRISIADTGIGIAKGKQTQMFKAFNRLGQEYSGIEGTGVGLVITQNLIHALHGHLGFSSDENVGSVFWFELPMSTDAESNQGVHLSIDDTTYPTVITSEEKQVLYIEDNPANIKLMQKFFDRHQQIKLHVAESAENGLKYIAKQKPDAILIDVNLPGMSGSEAARLIKNDPQLQRIPIIAISAAAMKQDIEKYSHLFDGYITKPVNFSLLMDELSRRLRIAKKASVSNLS